MFKNDVIILFKNKGMEKSNTKESQQVDIRSQEGENYKHLGDSDQMKRHEGTNLVTLTMTNNIR